MADARARLIDARQFLDAADLLTGAGNGDVVATNAIHAAIAASDVICCARLGVHAKGDSHDEAKALLGAAMAGVDKHLATPLAMKTRAGHSADPATRDMLVRAGRAMDHLVAAARTAHAT